MKGSRSAELVSQGIIRLCHAGLDSRTFSIESVQRLKKAIPVDASFFATADLTTLSLQKPYWTTSWRAPRPNSLRTSMSRSYRRTTESLPCRSAACTSLLEVESEV